MTSVLTALLFFLKSSTRSTDWVVGFFPPGVPRHSRATQGAVYNNQTLGERSLISSLTSTVSVTSESRTYLLICSRTSCHWADPSELFYFNSILSSVDLIWLCFWWGMFVEYFVGNIQNCEDNFSLNVSVQLLDICARWQNRHLYCSHLYNKDVPNESYLKFTTLH